MSSSSSSDFPENTEGPVTTADFLKPTARMTSSLSASSMPASSSGDFFIANERNRPFLEHQTDQLPSRQKGAWGTVLIFLIVAVLLVAASAPSISDYRALQQNGVLVSGTVTARNTYVSHSKNGTTTTYSIIYQYTGRAANGELQTYSASQNVYYGTYSRYPNGAAIGILYMPGKPADSVIASDSSNYDTAMLFMITGIVMAIICLLFIVTLWRRMIQWAQLGREGVMLDGTLTVRPAIGSPAKAPIIRSNSLIRLSIYKPMNNTIKRFH
jgi:hypothetical protein